MAKNFVQEGSVIRWENTSGEDVVSGQAVKVGDMVGVAQLDIPADGEGAVKLDGVWQLPKVDTIALGQGDTVYLDAEGLITNVPLDNTKAGYAAKAAEMTDILAEVLLGR